MRHVFSKHNPQNDVSPPSFPPSLAFFLGSDGGYLCVSLKLLFK